MVVSAQTSAKIGKGLTYQISTTKKNHQKSPKNQAIGNNGVIDMKL